MNPLFQSCISNIRYKADFEGINDPVKFHSKHACSFDIQSAKDYDIWFGKVVIVETGLHLEIPLGFEALVRGRSGLASKGIQPYGGIVDSDYTGEIKVLLSCCNLEFTPEKPFHIVKGDRVAQCAFKKVCFLSDTSEMTFEKVDVLKETERGENGLGSTGN